MKLGIKREVFLYYTSIYNKEKLEENQELIDSTSLEV